MNVISFGSCLSNITVSIMYKMFGIKVLSTIANVRSDQFYHYFIAKDKIMIPREYIENNLISLSENENDPNYVPYQQMLDYQYPETLGQRGLAKTNFFDAIYKEKVDVVIIDNYVDISAKLSYPKQYDQYKDSPIMIRKQDFSNYDDFFVLGEQLDYHQSIYYFNELVKYIKSFQPDVTIYFIHYPYNTYVNNYERQKKARAFERLFKNANITIVPAANIPPLYRKENDPAHFEMEVYNTLAGFIYYNYEVNKNRPSINNFFNRSKVFENREDSVVISPCHFKKDDSWSVAVNIYEYQNDKQFNFFLGQKGSADSSMLRRREQLEFRTSDGIYIGGVDFFMHTINEAVITYDNGEFLFYNNGLKSKPIYHPTESVFNMIGNTYAQSYDVPSLISSVSVWNKTLSESEISVCFQKDFLKKSDKLVFNWNASEDKIKNLSYTTTLTKPLKIAIIGSCVTRDCFKYIENVEILYVARTSFISLISQSADISEDQILIEGNFERKMVFWDLNKEFLKKLTDFQPDSIILDFIDERFDIVKYDGGYYTRSNYLVNSGVLDRMIGYQIIRRQAVGDLWLEACQEIGYVLRSLTDNIILHKTHWATRYRNTESDDIVDFDVDTEHIAHINNNILNSYYDTIQMVIPDLKVIDYNPALLYSDFAHEWGKDYFHFGDQYYRDISEKITSIFDELRM